MSTLSALGTGAARAAGTVLVAGLLVALGAVGVQQAVAADWPETPAFHPVKARPGGTPSGVTVRLPDGRTLHFSFAPVPGTGAGRHHSKTGVPSPGQSGDGATSGSPSGTPSGQPGGDPSVSGLPVPVISPLFPSPPPSGSGTPTTRPSRGAVAPQHASSTPTRSEWSAPAQDGSGVDAVVPGPAQPERPASTVPPPLGPQALLRPDTTTGQLALPHNPASGGLGRRVRLLGVGLALIGTGAALFGWRIRRL